MNTETSALHEFEQPISRLEEVSPTRPLYWSVRRELWEYRSVYIAPIAAAGVFLFGFLIRIVHQRLSGSFSSGNIDIEKMHEMIREPYAFAALLIMFSTFMVSLYYSLESMQGERKDRSLLFWKSLPVSDLTTVFAKALIPIAVIPLLTFTVTVITQWIMFLLSAVLLMGSGTGMLALWGHVGLAQILPMLLYHLLVIHGLWYAPIYGYLMLVSAWARRFAFLWAVLPLLAIGFVEKIALNTTHCAALLGSRMGGGPSDASFPMPMHLHMHSEFHLAQVLVSPGMWLGLVFAAGCVVAAARIRRSRETA